MAMAKTVEILVHIAAPSSASDDARYRALASAYVDFQPTVKRSLVPGATAVNDGTERQRMREPGASSDSNKESEGSDDNKDGEGEGNKASSNDGIDHKDGNAIFSPTQPFPSLRSPNASFGSAWGNHDSPLIPRRPQQPLFSQPEDSQSSWKSLPSVVPDSVPDNYTTLAGYSSPTRVLENYLQSFDSSQSTSSLSDGGSQAKEASPAKDDFPAKDRSPVRDGSGYLIHGASLDNTKATQPDAEPASLDNSKATQPDAEPEQSSASRGRHTTEEPHEHPVVPCTPGYQLQSTARSTSSWLTCTSSTSSCQKDKRKRSRGAEAEEDEAIEETFIAPWSGAVRNPRADSEPPPSKIQKTTSTDIPGSTAMLRTTSDIGPSSTADNTLQNSTIVFVPEHGYTFDDLVVHAPEPPTSISQARPADFIAPPLAKLAQDCNVHKRYRPRAQARDLRPTERGYWLVDCTSWDAPARRQGWAYLVNYIATGQAGWGVWCARDAAFRAVRVYCWGVVVPHIYFLLYLASERKILYTGCSWRDGGGDVVVTMGVRDRPPPQ